MRPKNILLQTIGVCNIFLHTSVKTIIVLLSFFALLLWVNEHEFYEIKCTPSRCIYYDMWEKINIVITPQDDFPPCSTKKNQSLLTILAKNNNIPIIISLYIPWHFLALFKFKHTCNSSCQQAVFLFVFQLWVSQRQRWEGWTISPMFHWYKLREKSNYKG